MIEASISACRVSFTNLLNFSWSLQGKAGEYLQRHRLGSGVPYLNTFLLDLFLKGSIIK